MQSVTDPADADTDASVYPWLKRLKYTETSEMLAEFQTSNQLMARDNCPVTAYVAAHVDDPIEDVEAYVYSHPEWGPTALCEAMYFTLPFNNAGTHQHGEFIAAALQHYFALMLIRYHPFDLARGPLSANLKNWKMRFVSPAAAYVILGYINQGHPNPGRFLAKPEIARHWPDVDLTAFASPDFPD